MNIDIVLSLQKSQDTFLYGSHRKTTKMLEPKMTDAKILRSFPKKFMIRKILMKTVQFNLGGGEDGPNLLRTGYH